MRLYTICTSALMLPALVAAQSSFVVPGKASSNEPGAVFRDDYAQGIFYAAPPSVTWVRNQYLYDAASLPVASANLDALSMRAAHNYGMAGGSFQCTIVVAQGPNAPDAASATFADNLGSNPVTVHSGLVVLPASYGGSWPAAWQPSIPFDQPVPFSRAAGGSLVVEFTTTSPSSGSYEAFFCEGYQIEAGVLDHELSQGNCRHSAGGASTSYGYHPASLIVGGSLRFSFSGYPTNTPSLAQNVVFFGPTGLGSPAFGFTTPFLVSDLGLPAPANCQWAIAPVVSMPMTYYASSGQLSLPSIPIPDDPFLAGGVLYAQDLAVDLLPTGWAQVFPSVAIKVKIGSGVTVPVSRVDASGAAPVATGRVLSSNAATLQLHY